MIALLIGVISAVLYFPIKSYAYFESAELVSENPCEILNEQPEISPIVSFDISQNGHIAVAFRSGYVGIYDENFAFERCIDSHSQDVYVLWDEECLMIYRWKINQYVKFDETFSHQEIYDIALTSHNRKQIHKLEAKNKVYHDGASYEMQESNAGAYLYLVKSQADEESILIDATGTVGRNMLGRLVVVLTIMLFGVCGVFQLVQKMKTDDANKERGL